VPSKVIIIVIEFIILSHNKLVFEMISSPFLKFLYKAPDILTMGTIDCQLL